MRAHATEAGEPSAHPVLLGKYRVQRKIGAGGMGVVLAVENLRTGGLLALKVVRREAEPPSVIARFEREARTLAQIRHPNVVQVFDLEQDAANECMYIVQELLEGETLRELMRRAGPMPFADAWGIVEPLLRALAHVHQAGVVHRDIKPENLFLAHSPEGTVTPKIIDFGIARSLVRVQGTTAGATITGDIVGTPAYMAPEQAQGSSDVTARHDVWSIGLVVYELLTGTNPLRGPEVLSTLARVLSEVIPRADALNPSIPAHVADALAGALQRDPARRTPSVDALRLALAAPLAPPRRARWTLADARTPRRAAAWIGAGLALLTLIALASRPSREPARALEVLTLRAGLPRVRPATAATAPPVVMAVAVADAGAARPDADVAPLAAPRPHPVTRARAGGHELARPLPPTPPAQLPSPNNAPRY